MEKAIEYAVEFFARNSERKIISGNFSKDKLTETKKCSNCLRRVELYYVRCPYCGKEGILFNDV